MNKTAERTVELDKGHVDVYTENGVTLYAYQTRDLIDDEVFILAKNGRRQLPAGGPRLRHRILRRLQQHRRRSRAGGKLPQGLRRQLR